MAHHRLREYLDDSPIIAILRGIKPDEVVAVADVLLEQGIRIIEIPLNSPSPLTSIERLRTSMAGRGLCGAGTVLRARDVGAVAAAGGQLIVSPNTAPDVIEKTRQLDMASIPGSMTPSEAFAGLHAGADALKIFPANTLGPGYFSALKAVLPDESALVATGGISAGNISTYRAAGASGFGIGSDIFKPGDSPEQVASKAAALVRST